MKEKIEKIVFGAVGIAIGSLFLGTGIAYAAAFVTALGGTGSTTPSGILYGDNGATSHLNTVIIGSGLTWTGTTLSASAGSTFSFGLGFGATTTTNAVIATTTNLVNGLTYGITVTNSGTGYTFKPTVSGTYTGVAGSVANSLSTSGSITGTSFNGSAAVSDWAINLANSNWYTARQNFTNATSSGFEATSTNLFFDGYTSALLTVNAGHQVTAYGGSAPCTNQVALSLSALGVITCTSINNAFWSGTALAIGNGGTNQTAFTRGNIWFDGNAISATSSPFTVGSLIATTTATSTFAGGITQASIPVQAYKTPGLTYATTTAWAGTTTIPLPSTFINDKLDSVQCYTDIGTLNVQIGSGTASTTMFNASTTQGVNSFSSNNTFNAGAKWYIDIGTPASSPAKITCTFKKENTAF